MWLHHLIHRGNFPEKIILPKKIQLRNILAIFLNSFERIVFVIVGGHDEQHKER